MCDGNTGLQGGTSSCLGLMKDFLEKTHQLVLWSLFLKDYLGLGGMVAHACVPNTWEAEGYGQP
jgi:hypothetical protein